MNNQLKIKTDLLAQGLLPLFYHDDAETSIGILQALYDAGSRLVEYTNRGQYALNNFISMKKVADRTMPGLWLGIGTIRTEMQVDEFRTAGADFIVSPFVDVAVGKRAMEADLLWIPGCMTPTDMALAERTGATMVKIFPGGVVGPAFISAVKEVFPGLLLMPTGGVEPERENLESWFKAGVSAVGMGGKLITKEAVLNRTYQDIGIKTKNVLTMIREIRGK